MTERAPTTHPFARDNTVFLRQGIDLLRAIDDDLYAATLPPTFNSSVGAHMRHIIDHFDCLFAGLESGRVDYDARSRDRQLETDRELAIGKLELLEIALLKMPPECGERALGVKMDGGGADDADCYSTSSVTRELQFLVSHTIHHYALVAAILGAAGYPPQPGFGVSPSTLAFESQRLKASA